MMSEEEKRRLGWSRVCCICGKVADAYNNPEPLRDGRENCCEACNQLAIAARMRVYRLPEKEREAYARILRDLPYESIKAQFRPS